MRLLVARPVDEIARSKRFTARYELPALGMKQAVVADSQGATVSLTQPPQRG